MLWAGSRVVGVSAPPAPAWKAGRCLAAHSSRGGREQHRGLQAGPEGTGGRSLRVMGKALSSWGVRWSFYICNVIIVVLPHLGRTVSAAAPLHLPAVLPAFPELGGHREKAQEPVQRPPELPPQGFPLSDGPDLPEYL